MSVSAGRGWTPAPTPGWLPPASLGPTPEHGHAWHRDGLHLPAAEVDVLRGLAERTLHAEPAITRQIRALAGEHDLALVGLEHRVKQFDSLAHKMAILRSENKTVDQALEKINDTARYRLIVPDDRYSTTVETLTRQLQDGDLTLYNDWNAWNTNRYKGVNLTWQTETGLTFEIQFHTQRSHEACTKTHETYKVMRSPLRTEDQRSEDAADIAAVFSAVPVPARARRIRLPESIVRERRRTAREQSSGADAADHLQRRRTRRRGPGQVER